MEKGRSGKLWFAGKGSIYEDPVGPSFHDPTQFEWANKLSEQKLEIINEVKSVIDDFVEFKPYFQRDIQEPYGSWSTLGILKWGVIDNEVLERLPVLKDYLFSHKEIVGCFISKLEAGCEIKEHSGVTNANFRCHLGIQVPSTDPDIIGISVKGELNSWGDGEVLIFLDADRHMVWNRSRQDRYVLILDVIGPEYIRRKNFVLSRVIATMGFAFFVELSRLKFLYKMPRWVLDVLGFGLFPFFFLYKRFNRYRSKE